MTASGCGPSLRARQQSLNYFERCYAADFDPRIVPDEKQACWSSWVTHYAGEGSDDRVDYARARLAAIEAGRPSLGLPGLPRVALGPRSVTPLTIASAPAEEPALDLPADEVELPRDRRSRRERYAPPLPRTSNPACAAAACAPTWRACIDTCDRVDACETACRIELSACARGCY